MNRFEEHLSALLKDLSGQQSSAEVTGLSQEYLNVAQRIDRLVAEVEQLRLTMASIEAKTLAAVATAIKSQEPNADLNLQDNMLTIGDSEELAVISPCHGELEIRGVVPFSGPAEAALQHLLTHIVPECRLQSGKLFIEGKRCTTIGLYKHKESL